MNSHRGAHGLTQARRVALLALLVALGTAGARAADATEQKVLDARRQRYTEAFAAGQEALIRDDYSAAVEAFRRACESSPDSARTGDALYWQAFARYRSGSTADLEAAAESLDRVLTLYRMAGSLRDAAELSTRIRGELARRGDAASAALIAARAMELREQAGATARVQAELNAREQAEQNAREQAIAATEAQHAMQEYATALQARAAALEAVEQAEAPAAPALPPLPPLPSDPLHLMALAQACPIPVGEEDDVRMAALSALAGMDPDRTLPILQSVLQRRDPESVRLRQQALTLLSMHDADEAEQLMLRAAREDPDATVRGKAMIYLGMTLSPQALDLLEGALLQPGPLQLKEQAIVALQMNDRPGALQLLRRVAEDPAAPTSVRARAILVLGERKKREDLDLLQRLYRNVEAAELKEAIVLAVRLHGSDVPREWLLSLIADPATPPGVLEKALFCIGEDKGVRTRQLVDLYPRLTSSALRRQAVLVIGARRDSEALDFIIRVAREEKEPEVQRAAIFLLGESRDPRALEVLQELIAR